MKEENTAEHRWVSEQGVKEDLQRQPHLFMKLAENALTVAESLRNNYFANTAKFVHHLRLAMNKSAQGERAEPILQKHRIPDTDWSSVQNEVVSFVDGGVGQVQVSSQIPILLRVGSYVVRTGERQLAQRETFGFYPVIMGDLEGGSKDRRDFIDIVRITAELLGGISTLERTPELRVLMLHGPLMYLMNAYAGHTPFTEKDIDLFLRHYASDQQAGERLKEDFLHEASIDIYHRMTDRYQEWVQQRLFEPLAWIAFLYRRLIKEARKRTPIPIIVGVVERSNLREFSEQILLERVFHGLRNNKKVDYFNQMYGRSDLVNPKALLDRLGYTDSLLLAMLLRPGEYSEPWRIKKSDTLRKGNMSLPDTPGTDVVDYTFLRSGAWGFPSIQGCYVHVSDMTEPIRIELFEESGLQQVEEAARRVYLYSRLLPGYGFPVGLDIADKYAHIPAWLTDAYSKLIRYHLTTSLQRGEITDAEMRRILTQAIYMTHRDWLFRPQS
jgi:hypothetical protein